MQQNTSFQNLLERLPYRVIKTIPIYYGSNNRVFQLQLQDGSLLLLKQYFSDDRRRMFREWNVYAIIREHGLMQVPQPMISDQENQIAIYEFIQGEKKTAAQLSRKDIAHMAEFLADLHRISPDQVSVPLPRSIMSSQSMAQTIDVLIYGRMSEIEAETDQGKTHPRLAEFLVQEDVFARVRQALRVFREKTGPKIISHEIPDQDLRLTPADFGPHNMIFPANRKPYFVDFEYGGWDHPLRVVGEYVNHDRALGMSPQDKQFFLDHYVACSPLDPDLLELLPYMRCLSEIEWIMIYISSMNVSKLKARSFADPDFDADSYLAGQIQKTKNRLHVLDA
ncbi:MAG: phosphotransferase [Patescibacteria group bacterium]